MAIESQQAQPMAIEPQPAQAMATESQQALPMTLGSQQVQPQADKNSTQTAGVTHLAEVPTQETAPAEQGQAAVSRMSSYEQHSYDPGSGCFRDM